MISDPAGLETRAVNGAPVEKTTTRSPAKAGPSAFVLTVKPRSAEPLKEAFQRLADDLTARKVELLGLMIYGAVESHSAIEQAMTAALGPTGWPVMFVQGASCEDEVLGGIQAFAISGTHVSRVKLGNRIVGSVYDEGDARFCLLAGMGPTSVALTPAAQAQQTFGNLEWALEQAGFAFGDIVRTWFFNDALLQWYGDFNRVRTAHYSSFQFRTGSLPASTGVAGKNPAGAALTVAALAMRPLSATARAVEVGSPLQCPAPAYGSSFSRATEIEAGGKRRLLISGTASIHPDGKTAHLNHARKQIDLTMEVIGAILQSRRMSFGDVTRATAYFKDPLFKPYFERWCALRELQRMPVVEVHCDICRDDLLFELELDATVPAR